MVEEDCRYGQAELVPRMPRYGRGDLLTIVVCVGVTRSASPDGGAVGVRPVVKPTSLTSDTVELLMSLPEGEQG